MVRRRRGLAPWLLALLLPLLLGLASVAKAAEPAIAVTVDSKEDHFQVNATIATSAPLATAWEVMIDFEHMTTILSNLKSSTVLQRNGQTLVIRQEGVARYGLLSFSFESEREVHLDPMKRVYTRQLSGTTKKLEGELRLEPSPNGTLMHYHAEIQDDSLLSRLFGATFLRHEVEEQFRLMVAEMEKRAKPRVQAAD